MKTLREALGLASPLVLMFGERDDILVTDIRTLNAMQPCRSMINVEL